MSGKIIFWAHSYCRSTLKFYSELARVIGRQCVIYTWIESLDLRTDVGFSNNEFDSIEIKHIGDDRDKAFKLLNLHQTDYNIFCAYQASPLQRSLIAKLISEKRHYGIISEAPCNMDKYPKHIIKTIYFNAILPIKLHKVIKNADFMLNFSGYYEDALNRLGWSQKQIISAGYFPPPVPGSKFMRRNEYNWKNFSILLTGLHQWHRSPWLLIEALGILKKKGLIPKCYITQNGPYLDYIKDLAKKYGLNNVEFLGFVKMDKLIELYETCSVYVGTGNYEPWGMRLNDVLLCGSPLIVNRGMGGCKIVDDYGCGLTFDKNDANGLANAIERMITDQKFYLQAANNAITAAKEISPENAASKYGNIIKRYII